jgi:multidrug efflux pump subunit AcrB
VKHIRSVSSESVCSIDIECLAGEDVDEARQRVRDKVDLARPDLPDDLDEPIVQAFNISSDVPIYIVALSGSTELSRLKHLAEEIQDRVELLPGVRQALVSGTREREIRVEVDLQRLIAYDIPIELLMSRVASENSTVSAGNLEMDGDKFQVRVPGEFKMVPEIRDILLTQRDGQPIYLRDVAEVMDTYKDRETISRLNGEPSVSLSIKKRSGENSVALIDSVIAEIEVYPMPPGVSVTTVYDESDYVDMMITELENNIASGFLLVIIVLFIFMGGRNSLFVAVAIPLSMLVAFAAMSVLGFSLNMMVLFSLVLAVGMLVDNAIVIVENIFRNHSLGLGRVEAARRGAAEVAWPVITSTITTCAAFTPLLFWPDLMGQFMGFLPRTLIIVLCASLFVAIVINPAICSALISRGHGRLREDSDDRRHHPFVRGYERLLRGALQHRGAVTLLSVLFLVLSIQVYGRWGKGVELFPEVEPRNAVVKVRFPQGTSIERTDAVLRDIEAKLPAYEDVEFFLTTVGEVGGFNFTSGAVGGTHVGNIHVEFRDMEDRVGNSLDLVDTIRKAVGTLPGVEVRVEREEEGPPTGDPISIEVAGDDFDMLSELSTTIIRAVETVPGLVDLQDNLEDALPELQFVVDRHRAALLGLDTGTIGFFLRTSIYGMESSRFRADEDEYDITLRLPLEQRDSATLIDQVRIPLADGRTVPLSSVGKLVYAGGRGSINRKDRKRVITISGSNQGRGVDKIIAEVQERVSKLDIPSGYAVRYAGDTEEMQKSGAFLARAFSIAAGLIIVVLVIQFNSVLLPVIIFLSVLLSIIGVMWGLIICGMRFGVIMTGVGVISLAGIVVNNAIVLMACILQQRAGGTVSAVEAVVQAGRLRLRPVLLTAVTTVLGLIPMAIGWSLEIHEWPPRIIAGSETSAWWAPMAVAVIFGLTLSTLLTLVLIPVLYSLIESVVERTMRALRITDDGHAKAKL